MANSIKRFVRTPAPTTEAALYTTPANTSAVVTNIVLTNTTIGALTATVKLGGMAVLSGTSVGANGVFAFDLRQALEPAEDIAVVASGEGLNIHISGMEVSA